MLSWCVVPEASASKIPFELSFGRCMYLIPDWVVYILINIKCATARCVARMCRNVSGLDKILFDLLQCRTNDPCASWEQEKSLNCDRRHAVRFWIVQLLLV
jgi:hypothetical protein